MVCLGYNNIFGEIKKKNLLGDNDAIFLLSSCRYVILQNNFL